LVNQSWNNSKNFIKVWRRLILLTMGLTLLGCGEEEVVLEPLKLRMQVTDYGLYQLSEGELESAELLQQRRKLPLESNSSFGFRFMLSGDDVDRPFTMVFELKPPSGEQGITSVNKTLQITPDQLPYESRFIHTLSEPEQLVPGTWVVTLKADDQLLTRQPFQLLPAVQ
jgi:hypothetical protein